MSKKCTTISAPRKKFWKNTENAWKMINFFAGLILGVWFGAVLMGALFVAKENDRRDD